MSGEPGATDRPLADLPWAGLPPADLAADHLPVGDLAASEAEPHPDRPAPPPAATSPVPDPGRSGPDLARAALASAKARAREQGAAPRSRARRPAARPGSGPDGRDPMLFGAAIRRLVVDRGWVITTTAARVMGEWDTLVGPELAEHCRPASLVDGRLELVAESSAWATQLRLMSRVLLARLAASVGSGVVTTLVVRGPAQPDWRRGPRRVQGRGPRDTYG